MNVSSLTKLRLWPLHTRFTISVVLFFEYAFFQSFGCANFESWFFLPDSACQALQATNYFFSDVPFLCLYLLIPSVPHSSDCGLQVSRSTSTTYGDSTTNIIANFSCRVLLYFRSHTGATGYFPQWGAPLLQSTRVNSKNNRATASWTSALPVADIAVSALPVNLRKWSNSICAGLLKCSIAFIIYDLATR